MSSRAEIITPNLLREWDLPSGAASKYDRGRFVLVGGARRAPGAAALAGVAALRVGAGRLTMAVGESVAVALAVTVPESGVIGLAETPTGSVRGISHEQLADELQSANAVVIGPGLDHPGETAALLRALVPQVGEGAHLVLDAYALGVLADVADDVAGWRDRLVLTPNVTEAAWLLGRDIDDLVTDLGEIADRYGAVVTCYGYVAAPDGRLWREGSGQAGLGTSGSGDVLAGAIGGLLARGAGVEQAACWGAHLHAAAGDRLAARIGPTGFLARELVAELPTVLLELGQRV
ncbi:NAD(P)H-hydrate dehydratase [Salinibacterium sp. ZJ454]|uniref:NAD(P)H-hydrate dehydratase n=1 Tax=Salinibacterium sp. ZJ454 TaxID=2708339 RepID=UPI0014205C41|nr:NAD(P)H-hydrate dehydratase [Salinibacterium sp. ZJ454]